MCGVKRRRFIVLFGYKLNQFGLRKCLHDHWLTNKSYKQYHSHSDRNFLAFRLQDGSEKRQPWIWNKIMSLLPHILWYHFESEQCIPFVVFHLYTKSVTKFTFVVWLFIEIIGLHMVFTIVALYDDWRENLIFNFLLPKW